ncbi:MAG: thrombospondin type 3 repeat:Cna B-type [Halieaceae bacterium]|jgi:MYXO-CTERM domain-containing protein|nr:thrombospondin type 3 repeat:Cna B-type [Halieaceae bacterium]
MFRSNAIGSIIGVSALALAALPASVSALTVIDFETDASGNAITHGQIIDIEYAPGVTISAENLSGPDLAVAFDTGLSGTADPDLEAPFYDFIEDDFTAAGDKSRYSFAGDVRDGTAGVSDDPGNVLIIQQDAAGCDADSCDTPNDEGSRPAGSFTIKFARSVFLDYIDFFDVEIAEDDPPNPINLFNSAGDEILADTFFTPNTGGDFNVDATSYVGDGSQSGRTNSWDRVFFGNALVAMIRINMGGSGGIDNIAFHTPTTVPVPAPATLLAFGALVLWRRRATGEVARAGA